MPDSVARVLIVEDEIILAKSLARTLKNLGYEVVGRVSSSEEALQMVEESMPDLILMDINLDGEVDGIQTAAKIRSSFDIPVVYLTGYAEKDVLERAKKTEPYGYLGKPVTMLELRSTIETSLYKHEADKRLREAQRSLGIRNEIAKVLLLGRDEEETFNKVLNLVMEAMESPLGIFGYINEEGAMVCPSMTRSVWENCLVPDKEVVCPPETWGGIWGKAFKEKKAMYSNKPFSVPEGHVPVFNHIVQPIVHECDLTGTLQLSNKEGGYDERDRKLLGDIAAFIAPILHARLERGKEEAVRKKAEERLQGAMLELEALLGVSKLLLEKKEFEGTSKHIFDCAKEITGATSGYVALMSSDGTENEVLFLESGGLPCTVDPNLPMPIRGLREEAYRTGKTVYDNDFNNSEWMKIMPDGHVPLDNVLFAPLILEGKAVGVIGLANKPGGFDRHDIKIASGFAELSSIGFRNNLIEEKLGQQNKLLTNIMESVTQPFYVVNVNDYTVEIANSAAISSGVTAGLNCYSATHDRTQPCDGLDHPCPIEEVKRTKRSVTMEHVHYDKDGPKRNVEIHAYPVLDGEGDVKQAIEFCLDITDRRKAEEALRESERKFRSVIDTMPMMMDAFDEHGNIVYWNQECERITGFSVEEIVGNPESMSLLYPDQSYRLKMMVEWEERGNDYYDWEWNIWTKDGEQRTIAWSNISDRFPIAGWATWGFGVDVTDRKKNNQELWQAQATLQAAMDRSPAGIAIAEAPTGNLLYVNNAGLLIRGGDRESIVNGVGVNQYVSTWQLLDFDGRELNQDEVPLARAVLFGETCSREFIVRRTDADDRTVIANAAPIKDEHGEVTSAIVVFLDITDHKKAEDQIKASLKEKEVLLREIHHRVKNNLAVIGSLLTLQSGYATDDVHKKMFENTEARVRSMALAHELLYQSESLADIRSGEYIGNLVDHLIATANYIGAIINVKKEMEDVSFSLNTAIPVGFLVTELVSNCLKHAFTDRIEGEIRVSLRSVGDQEFELIVKDNGVGMPEDVDFENLTSLGLDLVDTFVEQLKGKLEIRGDEGTEVRVRFKEI